MDTATAAPAPARRGGRDVVRLLVTGAAMGAADVVPGVSGGTVALVLGVYAALVGAVRQGARALSLLLRGRLRDGTAALRDVDWVLLGSLLVGILSAVVALASTLERLLEEQPVLLSAAFLGLVAGSAVVAARDLRDPGAREWSLAVLVAVVAFVGLGLRAADAGDPSAVFLVVGGAVAICAMILPGVSGSFLLLLLGLYEVVLSAVDDRDLVVLGLVALGAVVGLSLFSTLLAWVLERHHDLVLAAMVGLLVGSLRVLWPWPAEPDGVGTATLGAPDGQVAAAVGLTLAGFLLVVGVAALAGRGDRHAPVPLDAT